MVYIRLYQSNKRRQAGNKSDKKGEFVTSLKKIQASREDKLVTKMAKRRFCYLLKENPSIKRRQTGNKSGKKASFVTCLKRWLAEHKKRPRFINTFSSREACRQDMGVAAGRKNKMGAISYIGL